jgi:hypothetical protein
MESGAIGCPASRGSRTLRPEQRFGDSRFDFYLESGAQRAYVEVKGVTLEEDGVVLFPDAPTLRGVRHVRELCRAAEQAFWPSSSSWFRWKTSVFHDQPEDASRLRDALETARASGVQILAYDCAVAPDEMRLGRRCPSSCKKSALYAERFLNTGISFRPSVIPGFKHLAHVFGPSAGPNSHWAMQPPFSQASLDVRHRRLDLPDRPGGQRCCRSISPQNVICPLNCASFSTPMQKICELNASSPSSMRSG